jgi:hypothetical protein
LAPLSWTVAAPAASLKRSLFANARTRFHAAKIDRANGMAVLNDIDPALAGQADLERASGGTLAVAPNVPAGGVCSGGTAKLIVSTSKSARSAASPASK